MGFLEDCSPKREETYDEDGKLHSFNDEPSQVFYSAFRGEVCRMKWHKHGVLHRGGDKPCFLEFNNEGELTRVKWLVDDCFHRDGDVPAKVFYENDLTSCLVEWFEHNRFKQRDGNLPNSICCWFDDNTREEQWFTEEEESLALFHNLAGPSIISYENDRVVSVKYHVRGNFFQEREEWLRRKEVQDYFRRVKNASSGSIMTNIAF